MAAEEALADGGDNAECTMLNASCIMSNMPRRGDSFAANHGGFLPTEKKETLLFHGEVV